MTGRRYYKPTRLPAEVFTEAELARAKLLMSRDALKRLPKDICDPNFCPICNKPLRKVEVRTAVGFAYCDACGYKQPTINVEAISADPVILASAMGLGLLAGLGIAALLYLLFKSTGGEE